MEVVSISTAGLLTLKRIFSNILSGNKDYLVINRTALKEVDVPERFLIEVQSNPNCFILFSFSPNQTKKNKEKVCHSVAEARVLGHAGRSTWVLP
jgi:hypothetical protein